MQVMSTLTVGAIGDLLRDWRQQRRLSQLDLALEAEVSPRHLSFVETGRSTPSREPSRVYGSVGRLLGRWRPHFGVKRFPPRARSISTSSGGPLLPGG